MKATIDLHVYPTTSSCIYIAWHHAVWWISDRDDRCGTTACSSTNACSRWSNLSLWTQHCAHCKPKVLVVRKNHEFMVLHINLGLAWENELCSDLDQCYKLIITRIFFLRLYNTTELQRCAQIVVFLSSNSAHIVYKQPQWYLVIAPTESVVGKGCHSQSFKSETQSKFQSMSPVQSPGSTFCISFCTNLNAWFLEWWGCNSNVRKIFWPCPFN